MTLPGLWRLCPIVLTEMQNEFFRKGGEYFDANMTSQPTACFMLALRSLSLLRGMGKLLEGDTFDSYDVLQRAFLEARDLLTTFRFDDDETRNHIQVWFKDKDKDAWKAQYSVCERFLKTVGADNLQLAKKWGIFSALAHPRYRAVHNSVALVGAPMSPQKRQDLVGILEEKIADYITGIVTLFITASFEFPGWVHLGCDVNRMATGENLRQTAPSIVLPLLSRVESRQ
jgi:hypothetical protein